MDIYAKKAYNGTSNSRRLLMHGCMQTIHTDSNPTQESL